MYSLRYLAEKVCLYPPLCGARNCNKYSFWCVFQIKQTNIAFAPLKRKP
ncbi:MAG: hypothetical protein ACI8VW_003890, partial [bacterium]